MNESCRHIAIEQGDQVYCLLCGLVKRWDKFIRDWAWPS